MTGLRLIGRSPTWARRRRCCGWGMSFVTAYSLPGVYDIPNVGGAAVVGRHEQVPVERLPRLRQGRAVVRHGPDHGPRRARDRARPRRSAPPQLHPAGDSRSPAVSGAMLDSGNYQGACSTVLEMVDYAGFPALAGAGAGRGPPDRPRHRPGADARGLRMPGSLLMISAYDGATVRIAPDRRGHGSDRRHLARQRQRDRPSPRSPPTRWGARSTGSGSSRATPRSARTASATTARAASMYRRLGRAARGQGPAATSCSRSRRAARGGARRSGGRGRADLRYAGRPSRSVALRRGRRTRSTATRRPKHAEGVEPGLESTRYFRSATSTTSPRRRAASATTRPGRTGRAPA